MSAPFDSPLARTVTVTDGSGTRTLRAFVQPLRFPEPEAPAATPAGLADGRRWLLIMEEAALSGPAEVRDGETVYTLLRREHIGGHIEGLLRRKGGAEDA